MSSSASNPDIILIVPPLTTEERYGVKFQSGGQTPPIGLASLAASLRVKGFKPQIIDGERLHLDEKSIVQSVVASGAACVGITAVTISIHRAAALAVAMKAMCRDMPVLVGGPHLTAMPEETMQRYPAIDIGVIGEGEDTLCELLPVVLEGKEPAHVSGIIYRANGGLVRTPQRPRIDDLDRLPPPAWDLLPRIDRHYCPPVHTLRRIPAAMIVASRGCSGQCTFCDRGVFGNSCRSFSGRYVYENLFRDLKDRYGIQEIQFRDDNFTLFRRPLRDLCQLLVENRLDMAWTCASRVDTVNRETLAMMRDAGCWQVWFGIESGSQQILDLMKKGTRIERIREAVRLTKEAGMSPCGTFMFGNAGETRETMQETIRFATELPLDEAHFCFTTPLPGAELYATAAKHGTFRNDWRLLNGWLPVFIPNGLSVDELDKANKTAFRRFYFRPRIVVNYVLRLRSWRHLRVFAGGFMALLQWLLAKKRSAMDRSEAASA